MLFAFVVADWAKKTRTIDKALFGIIFED